jgi:DNA polymerase-3 subunit delta'
MPWSNILGHDQWIDSFRAVQRRGRLAHAYLFVGPEGIGKATFAYRLARHVLAHPEERDPFGQSLEVAADSAAARQVEWRVQWLSEREREGRTPRKAVMILNRMVDYQT